MRRVLAILSLAACLLAPHAADAHVGLVERVAFEAPALPLEVASPRQLLVAGERTDFRWPIVLIVLVATVPLVRRRSRRLVAAVLALLISILSVEAAVHSTHHGLSDDPVACPTASVSAHLDGTTVAALALDEPIQPPGAVAPQPGPILASPRSLDPSQPRAPPSPLV